MVDFGGWDMPVQYSGIIEEHHAVRRAVGLFDVSHMGEIEIRGPGGFSAHRLRHHQRRLEAAARAGAVFRPALRSRRLCRRHPGPQGRATITIFLCVNASNQEKDYEHIRAQNRWDAAVEFASERYAQLAIQGPLRASHAAEADVSRISQDDPLLRVCRRRGVRRSGADRPHRLHRRGWLRDLHRSRREAERIWKRSAGSGRGVRHQALRPGRAQHAAAGSQDGALRP